MEKNKKPTIGEQIAQVKQDITANSKDAHWAQKLLSKLTALQKEADNEPVELIVPCKEVKDTIDFGACKVSRTIRGYLFEAKGGLHTFVSLRMERVCAVFNTLFELSKKTDEVDKEIYDAFSNAVQYIGQALIFSSLNEKSLFANATAMIHNFNEYCDEHYHNAEEVEETEEDIKENMELEKASEAMEMLASDDL